MWPPRVSISILRSSPASLRATRSNSSASPARPPSHALSAARNRRSARTLSPWVSGADSAPARAAESPRLAEDEGLRAERLFRAADNAWLGGRAGDAEELLRVARKLAGDDLRIEIDTLGGHIAMRRGAVLEGYRALVAAAEAIEPRDRLKAI